jgi:opacity protein-like surface antigen
MKKIVLAALAVVAMGAQAADEGVYGGLNYNHAKAGGDATGSLNGVGLYGGYRMGDIAVEVSRWQKTDDSGAKNVFLDIAAIPRMNVAKDVDVIGKVGVRRSEQTDTGYSAKGTSLVVGAGLEYNVMPQLTLRALVDYSNKTFGESGFHLTTSTLGVAYKF